VTFVGMVAERHSSGSALGQLQRVIWKRQFEALRDGDRFFYANEPTSDHRGPASLRRARPVVRSPGAIRP
jgi:Animal haem peroxidase